MKKIVLNLIVYVVLMPGAAAGMVDGFMDSCEKGSMQSCYQAGVLYWTGEGASKNIKVARSLMEISCDGGFDDACVALQTLKKDTVSVASSQKVVRASMQSGSRYSGRIDGRLLGDIDQDGKKETVAWKKSLTSDLGDYYQLMVLDDDGSLIWKASGKEDYEDPLAFYSLDIGESLPQVLTDFDQDGSVELLAPMAQSDVSPTYYRKLRWRGSYFEPLLQNALMLSSSDSNRFTWKATLASYGTWVSKMAPYGNDLVKANVTEYSKDGSVRMGVALIRFERAGATVNRWIEPIASLGTTETQSEAPPVSRQENIGLVYGLDPQGDGFLAIRKKPNSTQIGKLYNGDRVELLGRSGKWYKIRDSKSGRIGWSHSNWITPD